MKFEWLITVKMGYKYKRENRKIVPVLDEKINIKAKNKLKELKNNKELLNHYLIILNKILKSIFL